jgi:c-di-GMP-binding flagellar brake protein YcgR
LGKKTHGFSKKLNRGAKQVDYTTFQVGMKVNIEIERGDGNFFFPSKVEDIELGNLVLDIPMKGNQLFHIGLNESVNIHFFKGDSFYYFIGKVVGKKYTPIPVLHVKPASPPIKNQRRDFFRIKVTLKVKISLLDTGEWANGYIKDISGSGALITTNRELKKGDLINLEITLVSKILEVKSRAVRVWKEERSQCSNMYYVAVQFVDIDEVKQDEIIKFVLAEQRKLIKKGYKV